VGSGLTDRAIAVLSSRLDRLTRPGPVTEVPAQRGPRPITWVEPEVVVEVEYGSVTGDRILRHPVYRGLRADKSARDAVWAG